MSIYRSLYKTAEMEAEIQAQLEADRAAEAAGAAAAVAHDESVAAVWQFGQVEQQASAVLREIHGGRAQWSWVGGLLRMQCWSHDHSSSWPWASILYTQYM